MSRTSAIAVAATAAMLAAGSVWAADRFPAMQRVSVLEAPLSGKPNVETVKGARIAYAPGQPTGLHVHPIPVVGVVTAGSFVFEPSGQPARTLHTGDAFFEPANTPILRFDNASTTERAEITAFYLIDAPDRPLIKMLAPADAK